MEPTPPQNPPTEPLEAPEPKRLTRSSNDRYLGGVAGGLARYFGIDPVLTRIGFVVTTLAGGFGILAYVLAWIFVDDEPGEHTYLWRTRRRNGRSVLATLVLIALVVVGIAIAMTAVAFVSTVCGSFVMTSEMDWAMGDGLLFSRFPTRCPAPARTPTNDGRQGPTRDL